ncbi:hypothetical protein [Alloalcanivorax gelatiniphagus]|uniref:N-acetyltransferase domain-containing protein n=1 Tax=Alloalcanivorax gelatiniphagus TaxID=1194167 RepID=A0ABY2XNF1_9GAMM|nr:hypothetical protein [Alloalcanivorax gelatiniphagus]TMW13425.1 hypothetical protein FGS76_07610 [Alloalcanivorax gelatiniphagus]
MSHRIRPAHPDDNAAILALLESTPQEGAVSLNFERRPDYFRGARVSCEEPDVWVACPGDAGEQVDAVYNIGWRRLWVNGEVQRVRYAHDLRIDPRCRNGLLLHRLFRHLRRRLTAGEWMHTVILRDNHTSLATVASGRAGLPVYYPSGTIETSLIYTGRRRRPASEGATVRLATAADLPAMLSLLHREGRRKQFFPYYETLDPSGFLVACRGEQLVGLLGFWDQKDIKQTRVLNYRGGLAWLRPLYNLHSRVRGGFRLPPPGGYLSYLTLHTAVVADNDPLWLRALLDQAVTLFHGRYDALVCGFFNDDPLARVPARYRRQCLYSDHFLVSFDGDPRDDLDSGRLSYVDVARL